VLPNEPLQPTSDLWIRLRRNGDMRLRLHLALGRLIDPSLTLNWWMDTPAS